MHKTASPPKILEEQFSIEAAGLNALSAQSTALEVGLTGRKVDVFWSGFG